MLVVLTWNAGTALVVSAPVARPDAIVSLGSHEWERLPVAARLAAENPHALVLLTLPRNPTPANCHDCSNRVERLRRLGVDPQRVRVLPLAQQNTYGEALASLEFTRQAGIRQLIVVTSPYHTRRALASFRHVFAGTMVDVGTEPASSTSPARPHRWWFGGYDRAYVAYEWAAVVYYFGRYGVK